MPYSHICRYKSPWDSKYIPQGPACYLAHSCYNSSSLPKYTSSLECVLLLGARDDGWEIHKNASGCLQSSKGYLGQGKEIQ